MNGYMNKKNITKASIQKVVSSKWVKYLFWKNCPSFKWTDSLSTAMALRAVQSGGFKWQVQIADRRTLIVRHHPKGLLSLGVLTKTHLVKKKTTRK